MTNKSNKPDNSLSPEEIEAKLKAEQFTLQRQQLFSAMRRLTVQEANASMRRSRSSLSMFDAKQVAVFLQNPVQHEKKIRELSNYLYNVSPQYRRIIQYFSLLPTYAYTLEPFKTPEKLNKEEYKENYLDTLRYIEKMNLRHELIKAMKVAYKEDVYYGYILETKDSFFLMKLDSDYCTITSIEDGIYNYSFDFSVFDRDKALLASYPVEFQRKYVQYQQNSQNKYIELDSKKTICIKINEELDYPLPPFNAIFEAIFDLDEYKKIKKQKTKMDNFLLLTQKIPQGDKNEINNFTIDLELAGQFFDMLSTSVPDGISVALTPMDIEAIRLEKSKNDQDTIKQATRELFSDSGVPQQIFSSEGNTSTGLRQSIISDEQIAFGVLRQVERWVNRRLKQKSKSSEYEFHFKFLDMSVFNRQEVQDAFLKAAQSSMPVITEYAASLGLSPLDLYNKSVLENDVLGLHDMLKPLASSYTQSKDDNKGGAPTKSDDEISDSGQINRDANTDEERANK